MVNPKLYGSNWTEVKSSIGETSHFDNGIERK